MAPFCCAARKLVKRNTQFERQRKLPFFSVFSRASSLSLFFFKKKRKHARTCIESYCTYASGSFKSTGCSFRYRPSSLCARLPSSASPEAATRAGEPSSQTGNTHLPAFGVFGLVPSRSESVPQQKQLCLTFIFFRCYPCSSSLGNDLYLCRADLRPLVVRRRKKEEGRREQRAESREQRAESREQRTENREQRTELGANVYFLLLLRFCSLLRVCLSAYMACLECIERCSPQSRSRPR